MANKDWETEKERESREEKERETLIEEEKIPIIRPKKKDNKNEKIPKVPLLVDVDPEDEMDGYPEDKMDLDPEGEVEIETGWWDLKRVLHDNGALFLTEKITKKSGKNILNLLLYLAIHKPTQDVFMFLNCVAGSARTAVAIFDAMQSLPFDINTIGYGMTAGVGTFILLSGDRRQGYPHLRVMMHKPKVRCSKKTTLKNHLEKLKELQRIDNTIYEIFVARTGQPYDVIEQDMKNKLCMSAKEAQDYGIIDFITSELNGGLRIRIGNPFVNRDDNPDGDSSGALYDE